MFYVWVYANTTELTQDCNTSVKREQQEWIRGGRFITLKKAKFGSTIIGVVYRGLSAIDFRS